MWSPLFFEITKVNKNYPKRCDIGRRRRPRRTIRHKQNKETGQFYTTQKKSKRRKKSHHPDHYLRVGYFICSLRRSNGCTWVENPSGLRDFLQLLVGEGSLYFTLYWIFVSFQKFPWGGQEFTHPHLPPLCASLDWAHTQTVFILRTVKVNVNAAGSNYCLRDQRYKTVF